MKSKILIVQGSFLEIIIFRLSKMPEDLEKLKKYVEHYAEHIAEHADKLKDLSKEIESKNLLKYIEKAIENIDLATKSLNDLLNQL